MRFGAAKDGKLTPSDFSSLVRDSPKHVRGRQNARSPSAVVLTLGRFVGPSLFRVTSRPILRTTSVKGQK